MKGYGKIMIGIENGKPPKARIELKGLSRESLAELMAVLQSIQIGLVGKYNKCINFKLE